VINILSYFFYNLSNLILFILIPSKFEKFFFLNYSIASGIFTFVVFYHFSKKKIVSEKLFLTTSLLFLLLGIKIESDLILIWIYTFLLIYSDYFFSQIKVNLINFLFKFILMLSSFLLYNNFLSPKYVLIIKIILIIFFFLITFIFFKNYKIKLLHINSPLVYNFLTCLIYFSSLFVVSLVIESEILKIVYISFQLLIGLQLKIFDIEIRNINFKYFNLYYFFSFICFVYLITLCLFINSYGLLIFYLLIFLILNLVKKKFIVHTNKIDKKIE
jgi:hypothetical protein